MTFKEGKSEDGQFHTFRNDIRKHISTFTSGLYQQLSKLNLFKGGFVSRKHQSSKLKLWILGNVIIMYFPSSLTQRSGMTSEFPQCLGWSLLIQNPVKLFKIDNKCTT